jgi:hypothetical protein
MTYLHIQCGEGRANIIICGVGERGAGRAKSGTLSDNGTERIFMFALTDSPRYEIGGLIAQPGDILGRTKFGSFIEHRVLLGFDGEIVHTTGPGDVFHPDWLDEILKDGGFVRVVYPTVSPEERQRRFIYAERLLGVPWWNMNCHQTTNLIVWASKNPSWMT